MQLNNISSGGEYFSEGFRIFVDINEQRYRSAFTPTYVVKLTQPLYNYSTNLYVSNGSVLGTPDPLLLIPGIVHINGERIIYYGKDGDRLYRLRRGAGGTGTPEIHLAGSDVEDAGPIRYNNSTGVFVPGPEYSVFPAATSVNEGNSIRFQINTVNVEPGVTLYWTNSGTSQIADFTGLVNSGSFVVTGSYTAGESSILLSPLMDVATEGAETIIVQVRTGSLVGPIVATSEPVTINDISTVPAYNITPRTTTIAEGSSISYDVVTTGVAGGTRLYWTNSGSTTPTDFLVQINSGSFLLGGDYASGFSTVKLDTVRSPGATPTKSIVLQLRTGSISGPIVKTANVVYVSDAPDPAYSLTVRNLSWDNGAGIGGSIVVSESDRVRFDITTVGVEANTTLFYNVTGTTSSSDYNSLVTWGSFKTTGTFFSACANVIISFTEDNLTEGPETFIFNLYSSRTFDSESFLAGPITLNVSDTSVAPSVIITPSSTNVNEGQTVTFYISSDGIRPGNVLYWKNLGTTTSTDFDSYPSGSSVVITGTYRAGTASLTFPVKLDRSPSLSVSPGAVEEGPETIILATYLTDPDAGGTPPAPVVAPITVTIADTSKFTTTTTTTAAPGPSPQGPAAMSGVAGQGGAGGGGSLGGNETGGGGGGVGLYGESTSGAGGGCVWPACYGVVPGGAGGSGGQAGADGLGSQTQSGSGGNYGGGGGGTDLSAGSRLGGNGAPGAVRIIWGAGRAFPSTNVGPSPGTEAIFTASGSWTAPVGVTSVCVVLVGGGGAGAGYNPVIHPDYSRAGHGEGGGGGGLAYKNNITVSPGSTYTITVGAGGISNIDGHIYFGDGGNSTAFGVTAYGGLGGLQRNPNTGLAGRPGGPQGGGFAGGDGGGYGGYGGTGDNTTVYDVGGGGGGAGGYTGNGGKGGSNYAGG